MTKNVILFKAISEEEKINNFYGSLTKAGYNVELISPIDFHFCIDDKFVNSFSNANSYGGLILSSPRCVEALALTAQRTATDLAQWSLLPCFVVGETTDKLAKKLGLSTVGRETGNASSLCDLILSRNFSNPLLYPIGSLTKDTLKARLQSTGIIVEPHVVYETMPHPDLETAIFKVLHLLPAALVFFSPSGVDSVLPLLADHGIDCDKQCIVAIGPTTEKRLIERRVNVTAVCEKPTPAALIEVLSEKVSSRQPF